MVALVHLLTNRLYGFHRDELRFLSDARHLDWGFVAYPPPNLSKLASSIGRFGQQLLKTNQPSRNIVFPLPVCCRAMNWLPSLRALIIFAILMALVVAAYWACGGHAKTRVAQVSLLRPGVLAVGMGSHSVAG